MPIKACTLDGKPGFKWGDSGKCYTYKHGSKPSAKSARDKAAKQGQAQAFTKMRARGLKEPQFEGVEYRLLLEDGDE